MTAARAPASFRDERNTLVGELGGESQFEVRACNWAACFGACIKGAVLSTAVHSRYHADARAHLCRSWLYAAGACVRACALLCCSAVQGLTYVKSTGHFIAIEEEMVHEEHGRVPFTHVRTQRAG